MSSRPLRWALLALGAFLLAATFAFVELQEARRVIVAGERAATVPVLGQVPDFELVDRDGSTVRRKDLAGQPWVADFIFTRCALSCPRLTSIMLRLGADAPQVARVSFTVDPENDSPEVLSDYAAGYGVSDPRWRFLTGTVTAVEALVVDGFKLPVMRQPPAELATPDEPILHSNRFVLVDSNGAIRGYYEATDGTEYDKLLRDLASLEREDSASAGLANDDMSGSEAEVARISRACEREIVELHQFFEDWFTGSIEASDQSYGRFGEVLAEGFAIIGPGGVESGKEAILGGVRAAHGSRDAADFAIWIENVRVRECREERCLVTYEEWQRAEGGTRGRLSTAVLGVRAGAPNGLEWHHVHETWLPTEPLGEG